MPSSFVDRDLHGGDEKVASLQQELMCQAAVLRGHKVILKRVESGDESSRIRDARYDIHLQVGSQEGLLLGRTTSQVTHTLLQFGVNKGLYLPGTISICGSAMLVTMARGAPEEETFLASTWRWMS